MVDSVGIISTVTSVKPTPVTSAPTAPQSAAPEVSASAPVAIAAKAVSSSTLPNSNVTYDPQAGVITEFLSSRGNVQAQVPSAVAVAYLRAGLTADGLSRNSAAAKES